MFIITKSSVLYLFQINACHFTKQQKFDFVEVGHDEIKMSVVTYGSSNFEKNPEKKFFICSHFTEKAL